MVYLIDGDDSVRRGFNSLLHSAKIEHRGYSAANDFLRNFHYHAKDGDLIVLDLNLPDMSGTQLLKILSDSGVRIPVLVVTSIDDAKTRAFCHQYGVKAYMGKPVDAEALLDLIRFNLSN